MATTTRTPGLLHNIDEAMLIRNLVSMFSAEDGIKLVKGIHVRYELNYSHSEYIILVQYLDKEVWRGAVPEYHVNDAKYLHEALGQDRLEDIAVRIKLLGVLNDARREG